MFKNNIFFYIVVYRDWWKRSIPLYSGNVYHVSKVGHQNNLGLGVMLFSRTLNSHSASLPAQSGMANNKRNWRKLT